MPGRSEKFVSVGKGNWITSVLVLGVLLLAVCDSDTPAGNSGTPTEDHGATAVRGTPTAHSGMVREATPTSGRGPTVAEATSTDESTVFEIRDEGEFIAKMVPHHQLAVDMSK